MQLKGAFCLHIDNKSIYIIAQSYVLIYSQQIFWKKKALIPQHFDLTLFISS